MSSVSINIQKAEQLLQANPNIIKDQAFLKVADTQAPLGEITAPELAAAVNNKLINIKDDVKLELNQGYFPSNVVDFADTKALLNNNPGIDTSREFKTVADATLSIDGKVSPQELHKAINKGTIKVNADKSLSINKDALTPWHIAKATAKTGAVGGSIPMALFVAAEGGAPGIAIGGALGAGVGAVAGGAAGTLTSLFTENKNIGRAVGAVVGASLAGGLSYLITRDSEFATMATISGGIAGLVGGSKGTEFAHVKNQ